MSADARGQLMHDQSQEKILASLMNELTPPSREEQNQLANPTFPVMQQLKASAKGHTVFSAKASLVHYLGLLEKSALSEGTMQGILDTAKRGIAGVIKTLGNDEELDPFTKYLMFTHMYTPEQVKEIGHEEIHRREEKFEKELGLV
ncbi:unnamed protein product [Porites lobata]|uniref:Uncharacterized protein n=1 Tax=Porites lobata TaxID=104759 RepID=A0ABN8P8T5_9CNID|nr:unnamed protein product [Porites lobata]